MRRIGTPERLGLVAFALGLFGTSANAVAQCYEYPPVCQPGPTVCDPYYGCRSGTPVCTPPRVHCEPAVWTYVVPPVPYVQRYVPAPYRVVPYPVPYVRDNGPRFHVRPRFIPRYGPPRRW